MEVDREIIAALSALREPYENDERDTLRRLLNLNSSKKYNGAPHPSGQPWVVKGVYFPSGTEFKATYKGKQYLGIVQEGALWVEGKPHTTPSSAANSVADAPTNGWTFWQCRRPEDGNEWRIIAELKNS